MRVVKSFRKFYVSMLCVSCRFSVRDDLIKKNNEEKTIIAGIPMHTKIIFSVVFIHLIFFKFDITCKIFSVL